MEPISEFDQLLTRSKPPPTEDYLVPENNCADGQQKGPSPSFMTRRGLYWHFMCRMDSPEAMDAYRRERGLYMMKQQGEFKLQCAMPNCPYKMKAIGGKKGDEAAGGGKGWALFECNQHNHEQSSMVPIGHRAVRFQWHFLRRIDSLEALNAYRQERGMYMKKLQGKYQLQCAMPNCPYKMKALKAVDGWALFECDQHNHQQQMVPIRMRVRPVGGVRYWHFVCRMDSPEALDAYRRERGLYALKQKGIIRLLCSMPHCPYKMKASAAADGKNGGGGRGGHAWSLFECNQHNHQQSSMTPIGKRGRKNGRRNSNKLEISKLAVEDQITNGRPKLVLKIRRDPSSPTDRSYRCSLSSEPSDQGGKSEAMNRNESEGPSPKSEATDRQEKSEAINSKESEVIEQNLAENKPEQPEEKKHQNQDPRSEQTRKTNFPLAECRQDMDRIGAKWKLVLKEKSGSFLFVPPKLSKAYEDGVLLAFTDRGDHIRVDLFHGVQLQTDKLQRWPKFRGRADFLHRMQAQCKQIFGGE